MMQTSIDRDLVLDFFLTISKAEYALKNADFCTGDEKGVNPDWNKFGSEISKYENQWSCNFLSAIEYYINFPPDKQILLQGCLSWDSSLPSYSTSIENALILVRRVRNNLFHGAKYNSQQSNETNRNEALLRKGIIIVDELALAHHLVSIKYQQASI